MVGSRAASIYLCHLLSAAITNYTVVGTPVGGGNPIVVTVAATLQSNATVRCVFGWVMGMCAVHGVHGGTGLLTSRLVGVDAGIVQVSKGSYHAKYTVYIGGLCKHDCW